MWKKALYVFLISILPIIELRGAVPVGTALGLPFYIYAPLSVIGNLLPVPFILLFIPKILDLLERVRLFRPLIQWIRKKANHGLVRMQKYDKKKSVETTSTEASVSEVTTCEESVPEVVVCEEGVSEVVTRDGGVPEVVVSEECVPEVVTRDGGVPEVVVCEECVSEVVTRDEGVPEVAICEDTTPDETLPEKKKRLSIGAFLGLLLFVLIPLPGTGAWTGSLVASLFDFPKKHSFLAITLGVLGACVIMTLASEGVVSIFKIFL